MSELALTNDGNLLNLDRTMCVFVPDNNRWDRDGEAALQFGHKNSRVVAANNG